MSPKSICLAVVVLLVQGAARAPPCAFDGRGYTDIKVTSPSGRQLDATSCQKEIGGGRRRVSSNQRVSSSRITTTRTCVGVGPGAAITITGDASPDLEPLPAVEEIHRKAEAAYDQIMDQATKVADMRVVSNKLRGERRAGIVSDLCLGYQGCRHASGFKQVAWREAGWNRVWLET
eukprot:s1265_g8.t1